MPDARPALDSHGDESQTGVVRTLSELARELRAEKSMPDLLDRIVAVAVTEIDGAEHCGVSLVDGSSIRAVAATSPLVARLDQAQSDLNEGPCLSSLREQTTVRSDNMTTEQRWPQFTAAALAEGVRSMLSVQLYVKDDNLGALNLYSGRAGAFDAEAENAALALAAHAAVAMEGTKVENNLRTALVSRDTIGMAKGILMERYKISAEDAFALLVTASQESHRKLRDVADELAATGELIAR